METKTEPKKRKGKTIVIGTVIVLLIAALGLAAYDISKHAKEIDQSKTEGYNQGAVDIITYIASQASQCKQVPLNVSGQVTTVVSLSCLNR